MRGAAGRSNRAQASPSGRLWLALILALLFGMLTAPALAGPPPPGPPPATPPQPATAFGLSITLTASQFKWYAGKPIAATVTVGAMKATGLLANVALTDNTTLAQLGDGDFLLCAKPTGDCTLVKELGPNMSRRVYIRPRSDTPEPGKYSGSIQLIANEGKSDAVQVTTTYTSDYYIAVGIGVLALGVVVSFMSTALIRNRLVRLQMLGTAKLIRDRLTDVETRLNARNPTVDQTPNTLATITLVRDQLSEANLDRLSLLPHFYSPDAAGLAASTSFKDMIEKGSGWATALAHIVNLGFLPIAALSTRMPNPPKPAQDAIASAWPNLDRLAVHASNTLEAAPDLASTDTSIRTEVANVEKEISPLGGALTRGNDDWIGVQYALVSFANLAIAALLTIAVGAYVMVISHSDFGRLSDFWLCFFWGMGLPTLAQLGQATPSTIAASMGITLPKAA